MKMTKRQIAKDQKFISFSQDDQVKQLARKIAIAVAIMFGNLLLLFGMIFAYPSVIRNQTLWLFLLIFLIASYLVILVIILIRVIAFFKYTNSLKE